MSRRQFGFTLLEMIITIAVIGVVSALALPTFSSWLTSRRLAADFDALQALVAQLQSQAEMQAGTAALICTGNRVTAQISRVNAASPCQGIAATFTPANIVANMNEGLPNWSRVVLSPCDGRRLVFHADGSVCRENVSLTPFTLTYQGDPNMQKGGYRLTLSQPTGFVQRERITAGVWQPMD